MKWSFPSLPIAIVILVLVLLSVLVSSLPFLIRSAQGNDSLIGSQSYVHLSIVQNLHRTDNSFSSYEQASAFHHISSFVAVKPSILAKVFPVILGACSVLFFFLSLRRITQNLNLVVLSSLLFVISPLFIILHNSFHPFALFLCLLTASWYLFLLHPRWGSLALLLLLFLDIRAFLLGWLALFSYALTSKQARLLLYTLAASLPVMFVLYLSDLFLFSSFEQGLGVGSFLSSFGASLGYSSFILMLALIGSFIVFSVKNRNTIASVLMFVLFVVSLFDSLTRVMLTLLVAVLAARGLLFLLEREWSVSSIKTLSVFLVILGILFISIMTVSSRIDTQPDLSTLKALNFLKSSAKDSVVLSSVQNGIFIEQIARREALVTEYDDTHMLLAQSIFFSVRVPDARELLSQQNISHILVDSDMRNGAVWNHEDQGLLFLLEHSKLFVEVYKDNSIRIYRVIHR